MQGFGHNVDVPVPGQLGIAPLHAQQQPRSRKTLPLAPFEASVIEMEGY